MLNIKNVTVEFNGKALFENINLTVNYGDKIGLVGRNGSGKSTFMKLITKKLIPEEGSIEISDSYFIGSLEQHFEYIHKTVLEEVCSVLDEERQYDLWKGEKILFGLGFSQEDMEKDPTLFSGGWQVKINLAKTLLEEPNLLLLDEPTNHLDIYAIRWLEKFLKEWWGEIILITHDRSFMDAVINHTVMIHRGEFKKSKGTPDKLKQQIIAEEENYEKTRVNEDKQRKKEEEWIAKFGAKASKAKAAQSRMKMLEKKDVKEKLQHIKDLEFKFHHKEFAKIDKMIGIENLTFGYKENEILMKNLTFNINKRDKICVIGRNGNGKSTLLRLIAQEITPLSGNIDIHEKVDMGYFNQMNVSVLNPEHNIVEEMHSMSPELDYNLIRMTASIVLFRGDDALKKIKFLSGGEKARVMLGKMLLKPSNLLLLDEPTNHFDLESSESLIKAVKEFDGAVVAVTHNEYFLREVATKLVVFDGGKTFFFGGTYDEFLAKIGWAEE